MEKIPIKLELYLSDIKNILNALEVRDAEIGHDEYDKKMVWAINMQMRKQGFEIKYSKEYGFRIVEREMK